MRGQLKHSEWRRLAVWRAREGVQVEGEVLTQAACQVSREQFRRMDSAPGLCETLVVPVAFISM